MAKNANLHTAKKEKNDEFYTQLTDIEKELQHYKAHFEGKTVFCNCDDPAESNFWKFFHLKFSDLKLKKLVSTHYVTSGETYKMEYNGTEGEDVDIGACVRTPLEGNGDFRSPESIAVLQEADIVVTNPPFSLFREYVGQLMTYEKKFLIIGNINAVTYKEIFPLIKENKIWPGFSFNKTMEFIMPDDYELKGKAFVDEDGKKHGFVPAIAWFTNLDIKKRHEDIVLFRKYADDPSLYPKYDNYDAIEVSKVVDIPCDYNGIMGVPISFMDKYSPDQFELLGCSSKDNCGPVPRSHSNAYYNGYTRGKVITRIESNMPLLLSNVAGGTRCTKAGCPDIYQLYWRIFIKRKGETKNEV